MSRTTVETFKRARGTKESEADPRTKLRKGLKGTREGSVTSHRRQRRTIGARTNREKGLTLSSSLRNGCPTGLAWLRTALDAFQPYCQSMPQLASDSQTPTSPF